MPTWAPTCWSRACGVTGKKACLVVGHLLMLYVCWLLFQGSWAQTRINWDVEAPVTGASMALFYGSGVVFAVFGGLLLLRETWRAITGRLSEAELVMVQESEDLAHLHRRRQALSRRLRMTIFIFLGSLLGAMALGIPIAFSLLLSGVALMWHLDLFDAQILAQNVINGADSFPLLAVPFFMLAGEIMNVGGLSKRIVNLALTLVGHVRGGLGFVAILAACLLAALSGSAVADTAALAALLLPMMVKAGHDKARSGGLIASAGIIAPIIPPSIGFVIFGVAGNVSISKLFLAGIVPGLMMGAAIAIVWYFVAKRENIVPPRKASTAEKLAAFRSSLWALFLPVIVLFGLKFGIFTPTEAAVVAAVYALFVSTVVYREMKLGQLYQVFVSAAKTTAVIMFLVAAAMVSAWLITVAQIPAQMVTLLQPLMDNQTLLLIAIMLLVIAVGTAMDMTPTILIMTPVLMPVVKAAGIDPVYFGVLFIMNNAIGLITPPVGTVLNVVAGVGKMKMDEVTRGVLPFMFAQFGVMFLLVLFPSLVLVPMRWFIG